MSRSKKLPEALTADDLKALAGLPKVIVALQKLAAQANHIQSLSSAFGRASINLTAAPAGGTAGISSGTAGPTLAPALRAQAAPRTMAGLRERLPDFAPQAPPSPGRQALDAKLAEVRNDPSRDERLAQFGHDGDGDEEMGE